MSLESRYVILIYFFHSFKVFAYLYPYSFLPVCKMLINVYHAKAWYPLSQTNKPYSDKRVIKDLFLVTFCLCVNITGKHNLEQGLIYTFGDFGDLGLLSASLTTLSLWQA